MNCILPQQVLALKERLSGVPLLEIVTKTHRKPNGYRRFFSLGSPKRILHSLQESCLRTTLVHPSVSLKIVDIESEDVLVCTCASPFPLPLLYSGFDILLSSLDKLNASDGSFKLSRYVSGPDVFTVGGCCIIPGGFGERDVEGKILAAKYVRENRIPYLGICLGMQIAVIEYARSILGLQDANSTEFDPNTHNLWIIFMPEGSKSHMGVPCVLDQEERILESKILNLCRNRSFVDERHRHRYEVNLDMVQKFEDACLSFPGKDESDRYMEFLSGNVAIGIGTCYVKVDDNGWMGTHINGLMLEIEVKQISLTRKKKSYNSSILPWQEVLCHE
ncbi:uncharacterized protein [Solanum lycopersicum]|uniref:uncharacterized protein n=1 Tax=Solanum lycopersicum TaxID=4081 RepID=UPI003749B0F5